MGRSVVSHYLDHMRRKCIQGRQCRTTRFSPCSHRPTRFLRPGLSIISGVCSHDTFNANDVRMDYSPFSYFPSTTKVCPAALVNPSTTQLISALVRYVPNRRSYQSSISVKPAQIEVWLHRQPACEETRRYYVTSSHPHVNHST